jgi:hypothetical protein
MIEIEDDYDDSTSESYRCRQLLAAMIEQAVSDVRLLEDIDLTRPRTSIEREREKIAVTARDWLFIDERKLIGDVAPNTGITFPAVCDLLDLDLEDTRNRIRDTLGACMD